MPILTFILVMALVGVLLWAITTYVPMPPGIKRLLIIGAIVIVVIWFIQGTGLFGSLGHVRI